MRLSIRSIAACGLALAAAGTGAGAEEPELRLGVTNKLDYRRLDQDDVRQEAFRDRLELTAERGPFDLWLRFEGLQVSDASVYDPFGLAPEGAAPGTRFDQTKVTKRAFRFEQETFRATVGDGSLVFGRGLLLALFEDEELNFDNRPEGLFADYDHRLGRARAIAASQKENRFRGVFLEPAKWGPARVGGGFVEMWGSGSDTFIRDREQDSGAYADLTWGPASVYGEIVHREFPAAASGIDGDGSVLSAVVAAGGASLSGEIRDYNNFEHQFHDPPTALKQHTWTLLNRINGQVQQDIDDNDAKGSLVEADYSAGLFTSFGLSRSEVHREETTDRFWEIYGEAKTTWREKAYFTAAAAESEFRYGSGFEESIAGFGEVVVEIDAVNSLTGGVEWNEVRATDALTQAFQDPIEFRDRIFSLSYGRSPWLNLTASFEDTTDETETREHWIAGIAEIRVAENHDVVVSFGSERGGWKCSGGVCFFEPEFEGLKLRWVARY